MKALYIALLSFFLIATADAGSKAQSWQYVQAQKDKAHSDHLKNFSVDYDWFANFSSGYAGVPFILQRLLPDLAPDIWGSEADAFAKFGLYHAPADQQRPLPRGLGWSTVDRKPDSAYDPAKPSMHVVTLNCGACHIGRVRLDDGNYKDLVGAPNTQMDSRLYRRAFELTVNRLLNTPEQVEKTANKILDLLNNKPTNWFYKGYRGFDEKAETSQRTIFQHKPTLLAVLNGFASKIKIGRVTIDKQIATSYSHNGPTLEGGTPGMSDGSGDLIPKLLMLEYIGDKTDPAEVQAAIASFATEHFDALPDVATTTDILSTWQQKDKTLAQIDGSVLSPYFRNIAAIVAITGSPKTASYTASEFAARLVESLPPPAYPFTVDMQRAERGQVLFKRNCAICHHSNNSNLYQYLGVDFNRAQVLNQSGFNLFARNFLAAVPESYTYTDNSGNVIQPAKTPPNEILISRTDSDNQGYVTNALEGLWARAPYLHNGSVPTLRHLLAPDNADSKRPTKFVRGAVSYDQKNVGYVWDSANLDTYQALDSMASVVDTSKDGLHNTGHDQDIRINGRYAQLNWSGPQNQEDLADLLEYLKTL